MANFFKYFLLLLLAPFASFTFALKMLDVIKYLSGDPDRYGMSALSMIWTGPIFFIFLILSFYAEKKRANAMVHDGFCLFSGNAFLCRSYAVIEVN